MKPEDYELYAFIGEKKGEDAAKEFKESFELYVEAHRDQREAERRKCMAMAEITDLPFVVEGKELSPEPVAAEVYYRAMGFRYNLLHASCAITGYYLPFDREIPGEPIDAPWWEYETWKKEHPDPTFEELVRDHPVEELNQILTDWLWAELSAYDLSRIDFSDIISKEELASRLSTDHWKSGIKSRISYCCSSCIHEGQQGRI